jgi:hypothetical protein
MPKSQANSIPPGWVSSIPRTTIKIPMPANVKPPKPSSSKLD